eukprot:ctg_3596.g569
MLLTPLSHAVPNGGLVGAIHALLQRVYPLHLLEFVNDAEPQRAGRAAARVQVYDVEQARRRRQQQQPPQTPDRGSRVVGAALNVDDDDRLRVPDWAAPSECATCLRAVYASATAAARATAGGTDGAVARAAARRQTIRRLSSGGRSALRRQCAPRRHDVGRRPRVFLAAADARFPFAAVVVCRRRVRRQRPGDGSACGQRAPRRHSGRVALCVFDGSVGRPVAGGGAARRRRRTLAGGAASVGYPVGVRDLHSGALCERRVCALRRGSGRVERRCAARPLPVARASSSAHRCGCVPGAARSGAVHQ